TVELIERLARPERLLEAVHGPTGARIENQLVDRDRPHRDGGDQKPDHHELDDPVRMQEQLPHRKRCGGGRHGISLRVSSSSGLPVSAARRGGTGKPSDTTGTPSGIDCAAEDPKLREKPAPTGNGIDTPPKGTKLGRETRRPEAVCADWCNARLSPRPLARLHRKKLATASICRKYPPAVAAPECKSGRPP